LHGTQKLEHRFLDKRLLCACLGVFAFLFQVLTPLAIQAQNTANQDLPEEFRIICSAYGLIALPEDEKNEASALANFCPYCQLQQLSQAIAPKDIAFLVRAYVLQIKQAFIHRIEPAIQRHARIATPRSPPANLI